MSIPDLATAPHFLQNTTLGGRIFGLSQMGMLTAAARARMMMIMGTMLMVLA